MNWRDYVRGLVDLLLPRHCAVCGRVLLRKERYVCLVCEETLPMTYFWMDAHNPMAVRFNLVLQEDICTKDDARYEVWSDAAALFFYKGNFKNLTKKVKYGGDAALGKYLGRLLADKLIQSARWADADLVIPVPLHWFRRYKRGYNQAEIIAEAFAEGIKAHNGACSLDNKCLCRKKYTKSQATLDVQDKRRNVHGAFAVKEGSLKEMPRHIVLVDDVFTTGSTLGECQRAVREYLVDRFGEQGRGVRISAACLACVGE